MHRASFRTVLLSNLALGCLILSAPAAEKAAASGNSGSSTQAIKRRTKHSTAVRKKPEPVSKVVPAVASPAVKSVELPSPPLPVEALPPAAPAEPAPPKLVFPLQATVRESYSLPILWDGREVGRRLFSPGQKVTAITVAGESVECRDRGQTFQLPLRVLELRQEITAPVPPPKSVEEAPAARVSVAAESQPDPAPAVQITGPEKEAPSALPPPTLAALRAYLEEVERFVQGTAPAHRFLQYAQLRQCQPSAVRRIVQEHQARQWDEPNQREAMKKLRAAVVQYDFGRWTDFEASVAAAAQLLAATNPAQP